MAGSDGRESVFSFGWWLFLVHTLLECGLGVVKLRGKYAGFTMPDGAEKFARHHGISLLSLSLLGALVLLRRTSSKEEGQLAALVLAFFHVGCVCVRPAITVLLMHGVLALGFMWHAGALDKAASRRL